MDDAQANAAAQHIHDDLMYLSGKLPHRSAQTHCERDAAQYIEGQLKTVSNYTAIQDFSAIENYRVLFGTYYLEFVFVGILAIWWPWAGAIYGLYAFVCYLAEFMGFRLWARLMPEYQTQNVIGQFFAEVPRQTIVVMAHYDSGTSTFLDRMPWLRWSTIAHHAILLSMVFIIASCAGEAMLGERAMLSQYAPLARWFLIANLAIAGISIMYSTLHDDDMRGANNNASGVCTLLQTGRALSSDPIVDADVFLVATGSHEAWMAGTRHFLNSHNIDAHRTTFLNIESVGAGKLHIVEREGMLHRSRIKGRLREAVESVAARRHIPRATLKGVPTAAHILHARGLQGATVMALNDAGYPEPWNSPDDTFNAVDEANIVEATHTAMEIMREIAKERP